MAVKLVFMYTNGSGLQEQDILSFRFLKDAYTPYTYISAKFRASRSNYSNISQVFLYVNDHIVHHGLIDTVEIETSQGYDIGTVSSRGFTSLLCQNQIPPGLIAHTSINDLMDGYYNMPFVTHEDNSIDTNYIYVKSHSTMWDGVVNLSYKLTGMYPYIKGTNCVRISDDPEPLKFAYSDSILTAKGTAYDFKRMVSHFNMADINGSYGSFTLEDSEVTAKNIVRHNVFELDKQFLYNPQQALEYRSKFTKRGNTRNFCRYPGYNGEDLRDRISFGGVSNKPVGRIEISGSSSGIFTELSVYTDGFTAS